MQGLRDRSNRPRRLWRSPWFAVGAVVLVAAAGGIGYAAANGGGKAPVQCGKGVSCASSSPGGTAGPATDAAAKTMNLVSSSPADGATDVQPDTGLTVEFSTTISTDGPTPTITPSVTGSWAHTGDELVFTPDRSLVPFTKYTVKIPGGAHGVTGSDGSHLADSTKVSFTVADGSVLRLEQLLAKLGYLPLQYDGTTPSPIDMALAQTGTFSWRWSGLPAQLTDEWAAGQTNLLVKGAVMMFETENGLSVDGVAGPAVWTTLLQDAASDKANTEPLSYVLVTKALSQHLTAWVNGVLTFSGVPVNTGVPGATTTDGTFEVYEHVKTSDMKGTDVTGKKYTDPDIPWVSYFNGGEALHGYPRTQYGFPQSNGCVEMKITTAAKLWPDTPIGTLVTVQGPTAKKSSTTSTTTTTSTTAPTATTSSTTTTTAPTTPSAAG